jgi:hypothetical protein
MLALLLLSCGRPSTSVAPEAPPQPFSEPVPYSGDADDVGRFLAGLAGSAGSAFSELEKLEAWKLHQSEIERAWKKVEAESLPGMREFQKEELSGTPLDKSLVFYPFSGPDALMLIVFFPHNRTYFMVGLEPAGTLPTLKQIARKDLPQYLESIRETVSSEFRRSFFITREMDRQFRGQVTDGLLSPILLLLARSNHTVLGFRYVRLDQEGHIIQRAADYRAPGRIGNKGVEIDFRANADQSVHKLFYFSVNLSNERLEENPQFLKFLSSLKGMTTFFKATSYMTHQQPFTTIREQVLANSQAILQDDSGIPYRLFDAAEWQVQLYGDYERPYGSFSWLEQPDLKKAYDTLNPKPLGFRIGYGFSQVPSNLLLARRK